MYYDDDNERKTGRARTCSSLRLQRSSSHVPGKGTLERKSLHASFPPKQETCERSQKPEGSEAILSTPLRLTMWPSFSLISPLLYSVINHSCASDWKWKEVPITVHHGAIVDVPAERNLCRMRRDSQACMYDVPLLILDERRYTKSVATSRPWVSYL